MIDLTQYKPRPSKYKRKLKEHGVSVLIVDNYLERSYPYVCNVLNGVYSMSKYIDGKLKELIRELESTNASS